MVGGLHLGPDVPQHVASGLDRPGRPLPGYQCVPEALPPAAVSSGGVRSCTESLGLPAQHLRQEKSLPLQVVPALWMGLDLRLCGLLRLPSLLLHPPLPLPVGAPPLAARLGRRLVVQLLQIAGSSGERHGKLLRTVGLRARSKQWAASAGAAGRRE